jgi:hypothetical protein
MIFIEFNKELEYGDNIIKYRDISNDEWYYMYIDIETLTLLLKNFGIISTVRIPTKPFTCDNGTTSENIKIKWCGANIELVCGAKAKFYLPDIEQNY